jgi:uncharacterized FlaG/YvyC family protein
MMEPLTYLCFLPNERFRECTGDEEIRMNQVEIFAPMRYSKVEPQLTLRDNTAIQKGSSQEDKMDTSTSVQKADASKIQKAVDDLNRKMQHEDRAVVFDYDPKANRVWLNVVDKTTGKVLDEMPPEIIRKLVQSLGDIKGLIIDKHS